MIKPLTYEVNRPIDIICMGRVAVDLYAEQIGCSLAEANSFHKYLGGCAGNIAVGTARLGLKSMMFSCVGQDEMGNFLKKTLEQEGVRLDLLKESPEHLTGLVLLGINPPKHFPLMFYRNDCADMQLKPIDVNKHILEEAKAVLITGTGLSTPSMLETTEHTIHLAKETKTLVILDLDFRPVLWGLTTIGNGESRYQANQEVSRIYQKVLADCQVIVGTQEEFCIAGGKSEVQEAIKKIQQITQAVLVLKLGERGCTIYFDAHSEPCHMEAYPIDILNVLGAGDGFMSGLLRGLLQGESWETAASYANACGAIVVTRHGCSVAIPYWDELNYFLKHYHQDPFIWKSQALCRMHERSNHQSHVIKNPGGFTDGCTPIVYAHNGSGMNFTALKLRQGETFQFNSSFEFASLLMTGRIRFNYEGMTHQAERSDYFSQNPIVLHCPATSSAAVEALTDCEILLIETLNEKLFEPIVFTQENMLEKDHRGKDLLENTSYRIVRTVFDKRNRPDSNLVVGEIITFQGRWSSYPPHYHSQPEMYHYRFSEPQGFAFGEDGSEVRRIEHYDTYQILEGQEHAHCTAPGYALYTLWFIRHQEDNPYLKPVFRTEHDWTRGIEANQRFWQLPSPIEEN